MHLLVDGIRCAKCVFQIENTLNQQPHVNAKLTMSTRRLVVEWQGDAARGNDLAHQLHSMGYATKPFESVLADETDQSHEKFLLRCMTVAGFASGNMMLLSVALWTTTAAEMGEATRALMHWVSALIALPTVLYAGRPFYQSAWAALKNKRTNMDVPISVALVLTSAMSVFEILHHGQHAYFDSVVMLVFLLLIGRYLDQRVRGKARAAAESLLQMLSGTATVISHGVHQLLPIRQLQEGMMLHVAAGEKIAADGVVEEGASQLDASLLTGESHYQDIEAGSAVVGGMINLSAPIVVRVTKATDDSLLAQVVRLMEKAEQGNAHYVRLADKIARYYTPVVHVLALATFLGWVFAGMAWQQALLIAATVLIITCPCALGLAVPVVQVVASTQLFKRGILLKSGDALERLATITKVFFDKTGTLTLGQPALQNRADIPPDRLLLAAAMARHSQHPLSQALHAFDGGAHQKISVTEHQGLGLQAVIDGRIVKLGSRKFCQITAEADQKLELWLTQEGAPPQRLIFADHLRPDAAATCYHLTAEKLSPALLSGDRQSVVARTAADVGIDDYAAELTPLHKVEKIEACHRRGEKTLMVGDGLNDAAALTAAFVSMSPATALDITQNAADIVFQGQSLSAVTVALHVARRAQALVKQNFVISLAYNMLAVPLAMAGQVTPLVAAVAMAASSIAVVLNAQRLKVQQSWMC
ncbi:MAG: cadmium-translocating P-type ATPase [Alphaproteobacteria bacterium]|nr:cadmium-translocating P-type ATPase [Alphaproteobacteria bacterium]